MTTPRPDGYGDDLRQAFAEVLADSPLQGTPARAPRSGLGDGAAIDERLSFDHSLVTRGGRIYPSTRHNDEEFDRTGEAFERAPEDVACRRT